MASKVQDVSRLCRCCGKENFDKKVSIFTKCKISREYLTIFEMFENCTMLKIELGDGLPMSICSECMQDLAGAYIFIKQCKKTDVLLKQNVFDQASSKTVYSLINTKPKLEAPLTDATGAIEFDTNNTKKYSLEPLDDSDNDVEEMITECEEIVNGSTEVILEEIVTESEHIEIKKEIEETNLDDGNEQITHVDTILKKESNEYTFDTHTDHNYFAVLTSPPKKSESEDCPHCLKNFPKDLLEQHIKQHDLKTFPCNLCDQNYIGYRNLHNHYYETHLKTDYCPKCKKSFETRNSFYAHIRRHRIYVCRSCKRVFQSRTGLINHKKVHLGLSKTYTCEICNKIFPFERSLEFHMTTHTGKDFTCEICDKKFRLPDHLHRHELTHTGDRELFPCDICNKVLKTKGGLSFHKLTHLDPDSKEFNCEACGKKFSCKRYLNLHKRRRHTTFNHCCKVCSKEFMLYSELVKHMYKHKGRKTYMCDLCSRVLLSHSSLVKHKIAFHQEIKPSYTCQLCSKGFTTPQKLHEHDRRHRRDYSHFCDQCDMKFYTGSELRAHHRVHTGERPYKCKLCPKTFMRCQALTEHARIHSPLRPYQCKYCSKGFHRSTTLSKHMKNCKENKNFVFEDENDS